MVVQLYKNTAPVNRIDKSSRLIGGLRLDGVLREETSILNPTIRFQANTLYQYNYAYIEEFDRYYFIDDIRVVSLNLYEIDLTVDVLYTYKDDIYSMEAFIERAGNTPDSNPYIEDKKRVFESGYDIEVLEVENDVFYKDGSSPPLGANNFVLTGFAISSLEPETTTE